jgi:hypothetical protein
MIAYLVLTAAASLMLSVICNLSVLDYMDDELTAGGLLFVFLFSLTLFALVLWQSYIGLSADDGLSSLHFLPFT